MTRLEVLSEV
jgi:hypothetical protein